MSFIFTAYRQNAVRNKLSRMIFRYYGMTKPCLFVLVCLAASGCAIMKQSEKGQLPWQDNPKKAAARAKQAERKTYFGCAEIRDDEMEPFAMFSSSGCLTHSAQTGKPIFWTRIYAFPRVSVDRTSKTPIYQVYIHSQMHDWQFFKSATYKLGETLVSGTDLHQIDRQILAANSVTEDYALTIPETHFANLAESGMTLRVSGVSAQADFEIPAEAFADPKRLADDWKRGALKYQDD